ncbi:hypothetical protein P154DRAFT_573480 [Amniculicola lignicola CBS 123094]|uniref:RING-type domain-containing protein n=1 Tax=Amniculicola lignicola CBS 123094 TaxID=1392246 RepID=A0A6A5WM62_9PLEO|nr:hypothetical protein P154DRAFT_573480 [Amniculicola lignicola CBS 123094]
MPERNKANFLANGLQDLSTCNICKQPFDENHAPTRIAACNHVFGANCLEQWVNSNQAASNKCPMCRKHLFFKGGDPIAQFHEGRNPNAPIPVDSPQRMGQAEAEIFIMHLWKMSFSFYEKAQERVTNIYASDTEAFLHSVFREVNKEFRAEGYGDEYTLYSDHFEILSSVVKTFVEHHFEQGTFEEIDNGTLHEMMFLLTEAPMKIWDFEVV